MKRASFRLNEETGELEQIELSSAELTRQDVLAEIKRKAEYELALGHPGTYL